jgi:hypothetical protein
MACSGTRLGYDEVRRRALENGGLFHVAAYVDKRGPIGVNTGRCSARYRKRYENSDLFHHELHAEVDLLRQMREAPERIRVVRFYRDGKLAMARPCVHCQNYLRHRGVREVRYTNWMGQWETMRL